MKRIKKVSLLLAILMAISSYVAIPASAVGNYYDTDYYTGYHYMANPDAYYLTSSAVNTNFEYNPYGLRQKKDATATYVYNKEGASFMFKVYGYSHSNGGYEYKGDTRQAGRIDVGQRRFLRQWVYENGHAYCALYSASIYNYSESSGLWSPDSIGSYPYAND